LGFAAFKISFGTLPGESADPGNIAGSFVHADRAAGIKQVECVRSFEATIVSRKYHPLPDQPLGLFFIILKVAFVNFGIRTLKIKLRKFPFVLQVDIPVGHVIVPPDIEKRILFLEEHRDTLKTVGDLARDDIEIDRPALLEISELGNLKAVKPDLPSQSPGTKCRGLPIIFHETDIMSQRIDPYRAKAVEIKLLNIFGRGLKDDLVLEVVLGPVRVLSITAVRGATGRLHISSSPRLRSKGPQECMGRKSSGTNLKIVRLHDKTTPGSPIMVQRLY